MNEENKQPIIKLEMPVEAAKPLIPPTDPIKATVVAKPVVVSSDTKNLSAVKSQAYTNDGAEIAPETKSSDKPLSQKKSQAQNPFKITYDFLFKSKTAKTYTLLSMTFLFISILAFFAVLPTIVSITEISQKIEEYKDIEGKQQKKISNIFSLSTKAATSISSPGGLQEYIDFADQKLLPNKLNEEDVFENFYKIGKTYNVDITSVKVQTPGGVGKDPSGLNPRTYLISASADSRDDLIQFSKTLLSADKLYSIQYMIVILNYSGQPPVNSKEKRYGTNLTITSYTYE